MYISWSCHPSRELLFSFLFLSLSGDSSKSTHSLSHHVSHHGESLFNPSTERNQHSRCMWDTFILVSYLTHLSGFLLKNLLWHGGQSIHVWKKRNVKCEVDLLDWLNSWICLFVFVCLCVCLFYFWQKRKSKEDDMICSSEDHTSLRYAIVSAVSLSNLSTALTPELEENVCLMGQSVSNPTFLGSRCFHFCTIPRWRQLRTRTQWSTLPEITRRPGHGRPLPQFTRSRWGTAR